MQEAEGRNGCPPSSYTIHPGEVLHTCGQTTLSGQVGGSVDPLPFVALLVGLLPSRSSVALDVKTNDKS